MAKRFTDTEIWRDFWYRKLPLRYKLFWKYICDNCDNAGVWNKDIELAIFHIGEEILEEEALKLFNMDKERVIVLNEGKRWFVLQFVEFQYGQLHWACLPHRQVILLIEKYNLYEYFPYLKRRVGKGYVKGRATLEEKEKEKEKDKDKDKDKDKYLNKGIVKGKNQFLEFVFLTQQEYDNLIKRFGDIGTQEWIARLNDYIGSKGIKYKSHYHTILNWARREAPAVPVVNLTKQQISNLRQLEVINDR